MRVHEPYEGHVVTFAAVSLAAVLDAVYGDAWREDSDSLLVFGCLDGYAPVIPIQRVRAHRGWLAFGRPDRKLFSIDKFESGARRIVPTGPFYLIWENLDDPAVLEEGDYGWPYQLVRVDWVPSAERFPKSTPGPDVAPQVRSGFRAFLIHCVRCHAINGEGGTLSTELNRPVPAVRLREGEWLSRWIDDPSRIVPTARMPGLNPRLPDRSQTIREILAYLENRAKHWSDSPGDP